MADELEFKIEVITPNRIFYDGVATMVEFNTTEGQIGILKGHIPLTVILSPGVLYITEENGKKKEAALHEGFAEILQDKVIDTNFETFKKAFSGKVITSPLNIKWKKKPEKNKRTSDYSSIFNFLQALINEGKIDIILNLHTEGSKVGDGLYTQVGNIFCHEDENSFFSDKNETNQNLKNLKKSAKQYLDKTTDFQNIIKSLG
jgi:hypothetical protein